MIAAMMANATLGSGGFPGSEVWSAKIVIAFGLCDAIEGCVGTFGRTVREKTQIAGHVVLPSLIGAVDRHRDGVSGANGAPRADQTDWVNKDVSNNPASPISPAVPSWASC